MTSTDAHDAVNHYTDSVDDVDWDEIFQPEPYTAELNPKSISTPVIVVQQLTTPPISERGSSDPSSPPSGDKEEGFILVARSFGPGNTYNERTADLIICSSDSVVFYVHSLLLLRVSENNFRSLLPIADDGHILSTAEAAPIMNIVLHSIYDLPCAHYGPPLTALVAAVTALDSYGIPPKSLILPSTHLYDLLLSHAAQHPLIIYTLAAAYDLISLAVAASSFLLSFPLMTITDAEAERMGPMYLKRLFFLHFGRIDALKGLLSPAPQTHAPTEWCGFSDQGRITTAWALATGYLVWQARPDLSTSAIESALCPLVEHVSCDLCRHGFEDRIRSLTVQWSVVKRTI